jgi:hypothetical protein
MPPNLNYTLSPMCLEHGKNLPGIWMKLSGIAWLIAQPQIWTKAHLSLQNKILKQIKRKQKQKQKQNKTKIILNRI